MTYLTQWRSDNRQIKVGDNIVQQVYLPPTKRLSTKAIFGVRISEVINESDRKGFNYESLEGHLEKGISMFTIEQKNNKLLFQIQTFSSPGNLLTRLIGPIISIPYQSFCTRLALRNIKMQIKTMKQNSDQIQIKQLN